MDVWGRAVGRVSLSSFRFVVDVDVDSGNPGVEIGNSSAATSPTTCTSTTSKEKAVVYEVCTVCVVAVGGLGRQVIMMDSVRAGGWFN